jgi:hypothetical protein
MKSTLSLSLLAATSLGLTACSSTRSTPPLFGETTSSSTHQDGVPDGTLVETIKWKATVTGIAAANRKVTLTDQDGRQKTISCGPEVINFDQIRVGDQVQVTVASTLELSMANAGEPAIDTSFEQVALAPEGAKPGGIMTETQQYTATVTAINPQRREATLRLPDDTTRTIAVRPDVDLSQRKVGEKVSVRVSVAVAISVE